MRALGRLESADDPQPRSRLLGEARCQRTAVCRLVCERGGRHGT